MRWRIKEEEEEEETSTSLDDDERQVVEILRQFPQLVNEYENRGFLPFWTTKALRSVLVNIPLPPYRSSRPPSTLPLQPTRSIPESNAVPSSSRLHSTSTALRPQKKSPKLSPTKQRLRILEDQAIEQITTEQAVTMEPQLQKIAGDGKASCLVEEDANGGKEAEDSLYTEREAQLFDYKIGTQLSDVYRVRALPDRRLIPAQALLMNFDICIQPIQLSKEAIYAEARRRRKLQMQRPKTSKRPRT